MGETRSSPVHTAEKQLFIKAAFFVSIHFQLVRIPACHLAMGETCSSPVHSAEGQLLIRLLFLYLYNFGWLEYLLVISPWARRVRVPSIVQKEQLFIKAAFFCVYTFLFSLLI